MHLSSHVLIPVHAVLCPAIARGTLTSAGGSVELEEVDLGVCGVRCPWRWRGGEGGADNREQVHASYHKEGYDEFVCPSNLRNVADYVVKWPFSHFHEEQDVSVPAWNEDLTRCLLPGSIIYSQPTYCDGGRAPKDATERPCGETDAPCLRLFHSLDSPLHAPIILMTGQSDWAAADFCGLAINPDTRAAHPNLIHWFAQNGNVPPHASFTPFPIGINCFEMARALRHVLIQRYTVWRAEQCMEDVATLAGTEGSAQNEAVMQWLWHLDREKRASFSADRVGVLHSLLHLSRYEQSDEVWQMNAQANAELERRDKDNDYSTIRSAMKTRNSQHREPYDHPTMPCSVFTSPTARLPSPSPSSSSSSSSFLYPLNVRNAHKARRSAEDGKLAIANFGMTHSRREEVLKALCGNEKAEENKGWLTCRQHSWDGVELTAHYGTLSEYLYWLSPRGNGLESHRTWEALYLGCVPVLERSEVTEGLFGDGDLPVLLVDDMTQLSRATLLEHLPRFEHIERDFPRRKLLLDHWKDRVVSKQRQWREQWQRSDSRNLTHFSSAQVGEMEHHRCWGSSTSFKENW